MQRRFFGTDGIRGLANRPPLTPDFVHLLGRAVGRLLIEEHVRQPFPVWPGCLIGRDTRISGGMLESALASGLTSAGVDVTLAGVVPTPAVAFLTREVEAALGAVISASHNPFPDNGIKFFGRDGDKLDDARELEIERRILALLENPGAGAESLPVGGKIGRLGAFENAGARYVHYVVGRVGGNDAALLRGFRIVLDAANGAAFKTSPAVLRHLGAEVAVVHAEPDGVNINEACGCTHPEALQAAMQAHLAAAARDPVPAAPRRLVGVSHDGDADRVLFCDETGAVVDGDEIMAIAGAHMMEAGTLRKDTLVATVMSNGGLEEVIEARGGKVLRAAVGDRYVMEQMRAGDLNFGGEQSGHFIFRDYNSTGDGIIAAVEVLKIMVATGRPLSALRRVMRKYPQAQRSLAVSSKPPIDELGAAGELIRETEAQLGETGRILLRYSGTEPKIRLLIEGRDSSWIEARADRIAAAITAQIGA